MKDTMKLERRATLKKGKNRNIEKVYGEKISLSIQSQVSLNQVK